MPVTNVATIVTMMMMMAMLMVSREKCTCSKCGYNGNGDDVDDECGKMCL